MLASFLGALFTTVLFITVVLPEFPPLLLYEFPFLEEVPLLTLEPEDDLGVAVVTELLEELPARTEEPELPPDELLYEEDVELFEDLTLVPALFEELLPPRP